MALSTVIILILIFTQSWSQEFIECYECKSRGIDHRCADPFRAVGRDKYLSECQSGWCMKVEVGFGGEDGVGFIERKCLPDSIPDGQERCGIANYKGQEAFVCFCRGHICNHASTVFIKTWQLLLVPLIHAMIKQTNINF